MSALDVLAASQRTASLAPVVGVYLCLSAWGLLIRGELRAFLQDLQQHSASAHAVGAVAFFIGGLILSWQRSWSLPGDVVLNLVAVIWIFEGAGMLASPALMRRVFGRSRTVAGLRMSFSVTAVLGLYLVAVGLAGNVR